MEIIESHASEVDPFRKNVWVSGAYLRLAKLLLEEGKTEEAAPYFQKAAAIIHSDPALVIRKRQLDALRQKFNISH